jgi:hypothetical protein
MSSLGMKLREKQGFTSKGKPCYFIGLQVSQSLGFEAI